MASRYVVEHLNHLGIVAQVCREIGVADWLDEQEPGNRQYLLGPAYENSYLALQETAE